LNQKTINKRSFNKYEVVCGMKKNVAIVTTTIRVPTFMEGYLEHIQKNIDKYKNIEFSFIVVGDLKTPDFKVSKYLKELGNKYNIGSLMYVSPKIQREWIKKDFPQIERELMKLIPWNSIRRRNIGFLLALENDAETIITLDDDNYISDNYDLSFHLLKEIDVPIVSSKNKLVNHIETLKLNENVRIYPRGFPLSGYFEDSFDIVGISRVKPVLNMGLWYNKLDVDAHTNLVYGNLISLGFKSKYKHYALENDNYLSINTQNTSFDRKIAFPFNCMIMDTEIYKVVIERYDDIWSGLFTQKLINAMGDKITFGMPLSSHDRNVHDYVKDFKGEFYGMVLNDRIWDTVLNKIEIESKDYREGYLELLEKLVKHVNETINDKYILKYFEKLFKFGKIWVKAVDMLM